MPDIPSDVASDVKRLCTTLDARFRKHVDIAKYVEGGSPLPAAVVKAKVTRAYRNLMGVSEAPWADLVCSSTADRLEVTGLMDDDKSAADHCWGHWQDNAMDLESKIAHNSVLMDGRASALVWRQDGEDFPTVSLDNSGTTIVEFDEGSRRNRKQALRRWMDEDDRPNVNLYRKDAIYKLIGPKNTSGFAGTQWEARLDDAEWPLPNPYKVVPVVELGINRRLKSGHFPIAVGEYERVTGLIDRIHLLTFFGLVVAFWMGFPLRGVIGERILFDDENNPIPLFDAQASGQFQIENPDAKIVQYEAADRENLSIFNELAQLAMITKTPRHYFPMPGGWANLSADAIRASEGSLHAKVTNHKATLGDGWEEVCRLMGLMSKDSVELSPRAELLWADHEARSLSERADAASKLQAILPPLAIAEKVLNFSQDEWKRYAEEGGHPLAPVLQAAVAPQQPLNGNTPQPDRAPQPKGA